MATEIRVPTLGESVSEATVGTWFKKVGDTVKADEPLVELETDKVTVEVQNADEAQALADGDPVIAAGLGFRFDVALIPSLILRRSAASVA